MFLAPPVLDLICIRTLDLRLLCFCSHFGYQAKQPCRHGQIARFQEEACLLENVALIFVV